MKKTLITLLLAFFLSETSFAETYFFNECKISDAVIGNYGINIEKNMIEVELKAVDGSVQNFSDAIKSIGKNKIILFNFMDSMMNLWFVARVLPIQLTTFT